MLVISVFFPLLFLTRSILKAYLFKTLPIPEEHQYYRFVCLFALTAAIVNVNIAPMTWSDFSFLFSQSGIEDAAQTAAWAAGLGCLSVFNTYQPPTIIFSSVQTEEGTKYLYSESARRLQWKITRLLGRAPRKDEVIYSSFTCTAGAVISLGRQSDAADFLREKVGLDNDAIRKLQAFARDPARVTYENWEARGIIKKQNRPAASDAPTDVLTR